MVYTSKWHIIPWEVLSTVIIFMTGLRLFISISFPYTICVGTFHLLWLDNDFESGSGNDAGFSVVVDHLGRVQVLGIFGNLVLASSDKCPGLWDSKV